jgi:RecA/RadA recombinase
MPRRAKRLRHDHPPLTTQYLAFSHSDRDAWVQPADTFAAACSIAREMLGAGAHLALVIDSHSHRIVHDATRPYADLARTWVVPRCGPSEMH